MSDPLPPPRAIEESAVFVVGGTAGIGLAAARAFAAAGAPHVVIGGRNAERGAAAVEAIRAAGPGADVTFVACDARDVEAARTAAEQARAVAGRIDVLVNSVTGEHLPRLLLDTAPEDVGPALLTQALGPLLMTRLVLPWMVEQRSGCVLNVASDAAKLATPGETLVGAAMAAVVMFTRATALEAKRAGVRVNAVTPSLVADTPGTEWLLADPFCARLFGKAREQAHLGVSTADDQAAIMVFLASPAAGRITGQAISSNGGISAA